MNVLPLMRRWENELNHYLGMGDHLDDVGYRME